MSKVSRGESRFLRCAVAFAPAAVGMTRGFCRAEPGHNAEMRRHLRNVREERGTHLHEHCEPRGKQVPPLRRRIRSGSGRNDKGFSGQNRVTMRKCAATLRNVREQRAPTHWSLLQIQGWGSRLSFGAAGRCWRKSPRLAQKDAREVGHPLSL